MEAGARDSRLREIQDETGRYGAAALFETIKRPVTAAMVPETFHCPRSDPVDTA